MMCNMLRMGMGPLVLNATTSPCATYAACCNYALNLELIFYLQHTELNETMGLAKGEQFQHQLTACLWLPLCIKKNTIEVLEEGILSA